MSRDFNEMAKKAVPAEVHMIAASHTVQESKSTSNVGVFEVGNVANRYCSGCDRAPFSPCIVAIVIFTASRMSRRVQGQRSLHCSLS